MPTNNNNNILAQGGFLGLQMSYYSLRVNCKMSTEVFYLVWNISIRAIAVTNILMCNVQLLVEYYTIAL